MSKPRHILILEARLTGHHSVYLERAANAFLERGHLVTITVVEGDIEHPALRSLRETHGARVSFIAIPRDAYERCVRLPFGEIGRELGLRRLFGTLFKEADAARRVDHVFLPYLDYCLYAIGLLGAPFGGREWSGICMRPAFHYGHFGVRAPRPKLAAIKERLFQRLLGAAGLSKLLSIDELLVEYVSQRRMPRKCSVGYLHDPAEISLQTTQQEAREQLGIHADAFVVLAYGSIDQRKGVDALITACSDSGNTAALIVGKQDAWFKKLLSSPVAREMAERGSLTAIDEFVGEERQQQCFAASDAVWLGYRNHYTMSGVLVLAAIAGRPVIATCDGLIGWHTKRHSLGRICDPTNIDEVASALRDLAANREGSAWQHSNEQFAELHSWRSFGKAVAE